MQKSKKKQTSTATTATPTEPEVKIVQPAVSKRIFIGFVDFCEKVCNVKLTLGQRVVGKVCYDNVNPKDLKGEERAIAYKIFGNTETIPKDARGVATIVVGRGAGKSYILAALRLLHLALTVSLDGLAPGEYGCALIVAPDLKTAKVTLRFAKGAIMATPSLAKLVVANRSEVIALRRPEGNVVTIECLAATKGGSAVRGRSLVGVALEEAAFFRDDNYQVNDAEIFRAVSPRLLPEAQIILVSTPWADVGLLYELYKENHGHPISAIAAHAPTLLLRDDKATRLAVEREMLRDPDNAARELGAEFLSGDSSSWFDRTTIDLSVDKEQTEDLPPDKKLTIAAGADFGFVRDSSGLVIVQVKDGKFHIAVVRERRPEKNSALKPSEVASEFSETLKLYGANVVLSDIYYRDAMREYLEKEDLHLQAIPDGQDGKIQMYSRAKTLFREGKVVLPNHIKLIAQLKEVVGRPTAGGKVQFAQPRKSGAKGGGHGDLVAALVAALWQAYRLSLGEDPDLVPGTYEWHMEQARKSIDAQERALMNEHAQDEEDFRWKLAGMGVNPDVAGINWDRLRKH
ncbi:MAG: terminase family protein [Patescibacteria group bacterium]|nr:terminase family protein [Patescibacteria group bacterium]